MFDKPTARKKRMHFAGKYYPDEVALEEEIARSGRAAAMYVIDIEHLSGKEVQER